MSNTAEEIPAIKKAKEYKKDFEMYRKDGYDMPITYYMSEEMLEEAMQAHTTQRLTTVKEKVEDLEQCYKMSDHVWHDVVKREDVLTLIEEEIQ